MSTRPIGPLVDLPPAQRPSRITLKGRTVQLVPLNQDHADTLFPLVNGDDATRIELWDYMFDGPYNDLAAFKSSIAAKSKSTDALFFAVIDIRNCEDNGESPNTTLTVVGYLSLMNIVPQNLSIEIGNVLFSPSLQRTTCATEAFYLALHYSFESLGYRRVEWKCNALNAPSQTAALRLGFTFEGVFRQHMVVKGRNRDTAWFSILREEWDESIKAAMEGWLHESNFDADGKQKQSLTELRKVRR